MPHFKYCIFQLFNLLIRDLGEQDVGRVDRHAGFEFVQLFGHVHQYPGKRAIFIGGGLDGGVDFRGHVGHHRPDQMRENMDQVEAGDYSAFSEQPTMNYNDSGIIGGITGAVTGGTAAISASQSLGKGGSNPISGIMQAAANVESGLASIGNSISNVINAVNAPTLAQQQTEQVQQKAVASEETGADSVAVSLADALGAKGGASAGSGASVASGAGGAGGGGSSTMLIIGGIVVVGVIFAFVLGSPHSSGAAKAMGGAVIPPIAPSSIAPPLNPATAAVPPISLPTAAELTSSNVPGVSGIPSITNSVTSKTI